MLDYLDESGWVKLYPQQLPSSPVTTSAASCSSSPRANAYVFKPSLKQCSTRDSRGVPCELEEDHEGNHDCRDALFIYLQAWADYQGPVCRTRRGPAEYIFVEGPLCL